MQSMQRADLPLWLNRHLALQRLVHVTRLINQRAVAGLVTRLVQVGAHSGNPINDAGDALASAAAELDQSLSQDVDQ